MLPPEHICLYESMLVGEQWLRDAGYAAPTVKDEDEEGDGGGDEGMDIEVQLAPWNITRNFLQATSGKGMVKLYGPGDPSGRGEAFSFLKSSMKEIFVRNGEEVEKVVIADAKAKGLKYSVAEQQVAYKEEVCYQNYSLDYPYLEQAAALSKQ